METVYYPCHNLESGVVANPFQGGRVCIENKHKSSLIGVDVSTVHLLFNGHSHRGGRSIERSLSWVVTCLIVNCWAVTQVQYNLCLTANLLGSYLPYSWTQVRSIFWALTSLGHGREYITTPRDNVMCSQPHND